MTRWSYIAVFALSALPSLAHADAQEASVHVQAFAGTARLGDPVAPDPAASVALAGASVRVTAATRDWLAWEIEAYGAVTSPGDHPEIMIADRLRSFDRGAAILGVDAGGTVRLGVRYVPTATVAVGPHLRLLPEVRLFDPMSGQAAETASSRIDLDLTVRASLGMDLRFGARWLVGARGSARQALGLAGGSWTSLEAMLHASYYWYPRWWSL